MLSYATLPVKTLLCAVCFGRRTKRPELVYVDKSNYLDTSGDRPQWILSSGQRLSEG